MASTVRNIVAIGATSGLGFEALRQLINQAPASTAYRLWLGCRNVGNAERAYADLLRSQDRHKATCLPLELSDLTTVRAFGETVKAKIAGARLDVCLLCAAIAKAPSAANSQNKDGWSEAYIVNVVAQQYLLHLLTSEVQASHTRVVLVSSNLYKKIKDPQTLESTVGADSTASAFDTYAATKFIQLLNVLKWKEEMKDQGDIMLVSPGFVPSSGLSRESGLLGRAFMQYILPLAPFATSIEGGGQAILRAMTTEEAVDDRLLSKDGEWDKLEDAVLDLENQNKWYLDQGRIEREFV